MFEHDFYKVIQEWILLLPPGEADKIEYTMKDGRIYFTDSRYSDHFREYFEYRRTIIAACRTAITAQVPHADPPSEEEMKTHLRNRAPVKVPAKKTVPPPPPDE